MLAVNTVPNFVDCCLEQLKTRLEIQRSHNGKIKLLTKQITLQLSSHTNQHEAESENTLIIWVKKFGSAHS